MIATLTMCHAYYDEAYVPHFLKYYKSQGVDHCYLIFHANEDIDEEYLQEKYCAENVTLFFAYGEWNSKFSEQHKHTLLQQLEVTANDWIINVDIDEHVEADSGTLKDKVEEMIANGENFCRGKLIDRIAADGSLPEIEADISLSKQFPFVLNLTSKVLQAEYRKVPITRGDLNVTGGSHYLAKESKEIAIANKEVLLVQHYKWNKKVVQKLEERVKTHKNIPHRRESVKFLRFWKRRNTLIYEDIDTSKIAFFAIPKCASVSLRDFCDKNKIEYIVHNYDFPFIKAKLKSKPTFCILRNPVERVISTYYYLRTRGSRDYGKDTQDWNKFCDPFLDINDFIKNGLEQASQEQLHFLPQSFWVDMMQEPRFLYLNTLQQDVDNLCDNFDFVNSIIPHKNSSDKDDLELTQESINIINNIYQKDVELYMSNINPQG